ncbi:MAG: HD domain-containing phosphohydrolase [Candidatus Eremiobacterota bacterium]
MEELLIDKEIFRRQRDSLFKILKILIEAIEDRDKYWKGHSIRVTERAMKTAGSLGLSEDKIQLLEWAGYLHDIGTATTKQSLLHKTEKLVEEENEQLKAIPLKAHELLSPMNDLKEVARIILHKSEKFDGTGHPSGLKGDDIPVESKILNISEAYDSLTNSRPYRAGFSHREALRIIEEGRGTKYDPLIVEAFLHTFKDEEKNIDDRPQVFTEEKKKVPKSYDVKSAPAVAGDTDITIYGFGVPAVFLKGEFIEDNEWKTKKVKLLFLYLILQWTHKVSEDKIIDMFWPDSPVDKARQNLYNAVHHVRKIVSKRLAIPPKGIIHIHHSTYQINTDLSCWYDVNEFEKLYNSGMIKGEQGYVDKSISDFREAVELYRGRFLETYYDDWAIQYGYEFQEKFVYMLKEISRNYMENGNYQQAINYAQKVLKEDPCDQEAYCLIMESYFIQGKSEQVVRHYLLCSQTLQEEVDIKPSRKVTEIYLKARGEQV